MSYNEFCPECGEPTISVCRCPVDHAYCDNKHNYFRKDSKELEKKAERLYYDFTDNDPVMHSNRFPSWSELPEKTKILWIKKAIFDGKIKNYASVVQLVEQ